MGPEWQPGVVRRLFDKELDNNHEEPLLFAQLAAQQLRCIAGRARGAARAALAAAVLPWLAATLQVLRLSSHCLSRRLPSHACMHACMPCL
jgi:hypothetical protein